MKTKNTTFYCFSPPVMLATFLIEGGLLLYVLWRYKMSPLIRVSAALLFFLAVFQVAEYNVCGGLSMAAETWSRIGFVAITVLPPLGLHLSYILAKRSKRLLVGAAHALAAVWVIVFTTSAGAFEGHICAGNYAIFQLSWSASVLYAMYYYGLLLLGVWRAYTFMRTSTVRAGKALWLLVVGYFAFMLPTATLNLINPQTIDGIPSIMCGFAVLLALVLVFGILPAATTKRDINKH